MPFNYGLRYNALFWTVATRTQVNGQQFHFWNIERRPYVGGVNNGLGFTPTLPQLSWGISTETCTNVNGTPPDVKNTASGYIYTDAGGGKHALPILQISATSVDDGCFAGQDGTGLLKGFAPAEGILAVAPDIYSTPAVYLPDGTQVAWPTDNSILNPPATPDGWAPIYLAQYLDVQGNSKCEDPADAACNTAVDTLGRNPLTIVNGSNQVLYQVRDSDGIQRTYTVNLGTITVNTNFGVAGVTERSQTRTVVTSIVLPNGASYSFDYEHGTYGGLTSITLPTGGTISYTWATLSPSGNSFLTHRYVSNRTVTVGSQVSTWTFSKSCVDSNCSTVNTDIGYPLGNHTLYQHSEGKVVFAKMYNGAVGSTLLRQYDVAYNLLTADPNAVPIRITTTLENGLQSKVEYDPDTTGGVPGNVAEIREYGYGSGGPGALVRRTHRTYGLNANASYLGANIVDKVTDETVYDSTAATCQGAAFPCAHTQYEYDNYVPGDNPLQSTSGAAQHDYSGHGVSFTLRGNLTRIKRWRSTGGSWLTTTYSYDDLGNIRSIKDPLGHVTSYDYTDSFANSDCLPPAGTSAQAWVSTVTNALGQQVRAVRFPCTGLVQAHRDQNDIDAGRVGTTYTYDLMGRQLTKDFPDGGHTSFAYNDTPPVSTTTTTKITSALDLTSVVVMDGLGRNSQAQLTSDPSGTDYTDTTYDLPGRVATVSNPYHSMSDSTFGITTNRYDDLGRVFQITKQDGSISTVSYSGNCTTTTDEAGNQRRSCSDALGRLVEVDEPNAGVAGAASQGSVSISQLSRSPVTVGAQPANTATGTFTISGVEKSTTVTTQAATSASVMVQVLGADGTKTTTSTTCTGVFPNQTCTTRTFTFADSGSMQLSVNAGGVVVTSSAVSYNGSLSQSGLAQSLAGALPANSVVQASYLGGNQFILRTVATGTGANSTTLTTSITSSCVPAFSDTSSTDCSQGWSMSPSSGSFSGGANAVTATRWDSGSVSVTAGAHQDSASFAQGDTAVSVSNRLIQQINGDTASSVSASLQSSAPDQSSATIKLTAYSAGAAGNYAVACNLSYDTADFSSSSFGPTCPAALSGGTNATSGTTYYDSGTVTMTVGSFTASAPYGPASNNTASTVAAALAGSGATGLNRAGSPVSATASGAGITLAYLSPGTAGNAAVNVTSTVDSSVSAYFSGSTYSGNSSLTGGVDAVPADLTHPYVTQYSYDALGNLLCVEQHGNVAGTGCIAAPSSDATSPWRVRRFTYDSLSRLLTAHNPESGTITYSYDADGNLLQQTSPAPNQTGTATQTISYCYDELNRVTGKAYSAQICPLVSPVVTYIYDSGPNAKGKLTGITDQAGTGSYSYDVLGRLASETRVINGISKSLSYDYNLDGSLKALHYPSGAVVTYAPDSAGRVLSAVDTADGINYVTSATYQPDGQMTGFVSGNGGSFAGITSSFSYNKRLQPVNMSASSPSQTVFSIGYDFHVGNGTSGSDNGNVWNIYNYRDRTRDQSFNYDALNRLTSASNAGTNCAATTVNGKTEYWGNSYDYDAWGNLTDKTITKCGAERFQPGPASVNNQLAGYGYDAAGNMLSDPTDSVTSTYDAENRIASANTPLGVFTYTYDGDGNRVEKSGNGTGTIYWYMTPGIVAESDLTGNLKSEYVFFNGERVARKDFSGGTASVFYYFSDHLKTASVITDSDGNIKSESDYYPWGGELQFVNNDPNQYKFTGKERDSGSGLDYFGARYYSNGLGRFITPDWAAKAVDVPYAEFSDPQSLNLYSYVRNVPTTKYDADGHCAWDGCIVEGGVSVGTVIVVGAIATAVGVAAVASTPAGQRSFSTFSSAASASFSHSVSTIKGWFHKTDNASKSSPAPQSNPAPGTQTATQTPKDVYIDPAKYPASAGHAGDAIKAGQPDVLTVNRPGADANRAAATAGHPTQPTTDRDEYPPAVTAEGGAGASVRNIPSSDNRGAGSSLGQQIKDVPNGGQIKVNIGPKPQE